MRGEDSDGTQAVVPTVFDLDILIVMTGVFMPLLPKQCSHHSQINQPSNACAAHVYRFARFPPKVSKNEWTKQVQSSVDLISPSLIQISHLIVHDTLQTPLRPAVDRRPLLRPLPQLLSIRQSVRQL
jgi:hypothetical protein